MSFLELSARDAKLDQSLLSLAADIDRFEGYVRPHAERMAALADGVARQFNLAPHDRQSLRQAALVHDLGELVMNRDYIKRSTLLSPEERLDLMRHPIIGEQEAAKRGLSRAVQLLVRWHQEWWNGEGYPDGLRREQIPLGARILRVVDTYTAVTDNRPYSPALPVAEARKYLSQWAGLAFDPRVCFAFLSLPPEMEELKSSAESPLPTFDAPINEPPRRTLYQGM
jgi:HD-GYP domain-containing protein (c-di-GMP phosphodiesterase class II)